MCQDFDFDHFAHLARSDPAAFEVQRLMLFEAALSEMPASARGAARVALANVQVRMASARSPAERLAVSMDTLRDSVGRLCSGMAQLRSEAGSIRDLRFHSTDTAARR